VAEAHILPRRAADFPATPDISDGVPNFSVAVTRANYAEMLVAEFCSKWRTVNQEQK